MVLRNSTSFFTIKIDSNTKELYIIWKLMKQRFIFLKDFVFIIIILSRDHGHVTSNFLYFPANFGLFSIKSRKKGLNINIREKFIIEEL